MPRVSLQVKNYAAQAPKVIGDRAASCTSSTQNVLKYICPCNAFQIAEWPKQADKLFSANRNVHVTLEMGTLYNQTHVLKTSDNHPKVHST